MSVPSWSVDLSPEARVDFTDILLYTQEQWGEEQRDRYQATLQQAIAGLADFPKAGVRRDRVVLGCRVRPVEQHVLYYRIEDGTISVVRILHRRADPARHVRP